MKKIRQYQIAQMAGISAPMLCEILNSKARPSWNTAKRLAEATGSSPDIWMEANPEELKNIISRIKDVPAPPDRAAGSGGQEH